MPFACQQPLPENFQSQRTFVRGPYLVERHLFRDHSDKIHQQAGDWESLVGPGRPPTTRPAWRSISRLARPLPDLPPSVSSKPKPRPNFLDGQTIQVPLMIVDGRERARVHPVDVERSVQVIDLMLQDARVPALGIDS